MADGQQGKRGEDENLKRLVHTFLTYDNLWFNNILRVLGQPHLIPHQVDAWTWIISNHSRRYAMSSLPSNKQRGISQPELRRILGTDDDPFDASNLHKLLKNLVLFQMVESDVVSEGENVRTLYKRSPLGDAFVEKWHWIYAGSKETRQIVGESDEAIQQLNLKIKELKRDNKFKDEIIEELRTENKHCEKRISILENQVTDLRQANNGRNNNAKEDKG